MVSRRPFFALTLIVGSIAVPARAADGRAAATTKALVQEKELPVAIQYEANVNGSDRSVERGAAFLAATQGVYPSATNPDGVVVDGWEWISGTGKGAGNISGVVSVGLIEAYEATGEKSLLAAATSRAEIAAQLIRDGRRPFAPDIEGLARVGTLTGRSEWLALAKHAVTERLRAAGGVQGEVARLRKAREAAPELTGYEVALVADAAFAAGLEKEARELVQHVVRVSESWLRNSRSPYTVVSQGALLASATRLGLGSEARQLALPLLATQLDDGSWRVRETQPTAYATRGLALFGRAFKDQDGAAAADKGRTWLRLTQLQNGAWAEYNDYLPEPFVGTVFAPATAEALRAVVAAH